MPELKHAFVHVIESPSGDDLLDGRTEGKVLTNALDLAEIPHTYNLAVTQAVFIKAIDERMRAEAGERMSVPLLHISAHGNEDGIGLTDGTFIRWDELNGLLMPAYKAMRGEMLICISSCYGGEAKQMAKLVDEKMTFGVLIGHSKEVPWSDAALGYASFYHLLFKGKSYGEAYDGMRSASGNDDFQLISGKLEQTLARQGLFDVTEGEEV